MATATLSLALLAAAAPPPATPAKPADSAGPGKAAKPAPSAAQECFDRLATLVGEWDADIDGDGTMDGVVKYRLIANGSVLVETLLAGTPGEMETMIHLDGDALLCTHYCGARNQPRMQAATMSPTEVVFEFKDATNLPDRNAMHMGKLHMQLVDASTLVNRWTTYANGKEDGVMVFSMKRRAAEAPKQPAKPAAAAG
jgi:hypothetical protein